MKKTTLRKQITKPISILLAFVLLCSVLCFPASAAEVPNLKKDISGATVSVPDQIFLDEYCEPEVTVKLNGGVLTAGTDYVVFYENNLNKGRAYVYVIGIGDYYGFAKGYFTIRTDRTIGTLYGNYVGMSGGTLTDDYHYQELVIPPDNFVGAFDTKQKYHVSVYYLYRYDVATEEWKLLKEKESEPAYSSAFSYNFSSVYEGAIEDGGALYMLDYAWVDSSGKVYAGLATIFVPAKYADASSMTIIQAENDGDFRAEYLAGYAEDGNLGIVKWSSSDTTIATVETGGKVTFHKPGTVTVTGSYNSLSATRELTMAALDINQAEIYNYDAAAGTADVVYDGRVLIPGTDYTLKATTNDGVTDVTVTGCGLFEGCIIRQFDAQGEPVGHTHTFGTVCRERCDSCDYIRSVPLDWHTFRDSWSKDKTAHWHGCSVCGKQKDYESHTFNPDDPETCTVCGPLREPGDMDGDGEVDTEDAVYLLLHVLFGESQYPIENGAITDINGDGKTDTEDAVYLLLHVLFGADQYPI